LIFLAVTDKTMLTFLSLTMYIAYLYFWFTAKWPLFS